KAIVASDLEQIGQVLGHSYRSGELPATRCPHDESRLGVLVPAGNRAALLDGIRFLVERGDYREALGRNARREVLARYTWDQSVGALLDALERPPAALGRTEVRSVVESGRLGGT